MPRRRVLMVSHARAVWGAEHVILQLAPRLERRGFEMTLASPPGALATAWGQLGLEHLPLELPEHHGIRTGDREHRPPIRELAGEGLTVCRWTKTLVPLARAHDIVHSNNLWGHLEAATAGRIARRPVVLHLHDLVRPGVGRRLLGLATRTATLAIAISRAVAACVPASQLQKVREVPNGVDTDRFHPAPGSLDVRRALAGNDELPLVGILGRVDPEKGVDAVVRAVARLDHGVQLAVVGAPSDPGSDFFRRLRVDAQAALGERVRFVGRRTDSPEVLRCLDVLVNASRAEPFGLTVLEAQACGTPVVATDAGGIPEFVADGTTGLLVPPGDDRALAAAVERILTDPATADALRAAARRQAVDFYGLERQADAVAVVYHDVASPAPGGR